MLSRLSLCTTLFALAAAPLALAADDAVDTFAWLSTTDGILAEGILWNDRFGDGNDRYKSGGLTQSWLIPQGRLSDKPWLTDHAAALEVQLRGLVVTPDNTAGGGAIDRPYAQYVGAGVYLRTVGRPDAPATGATLSSENRVGVELGYQGDPLPLFEIQDALHDTIGMGRMARSAANSLDSSFLVNVEAKRTWRLHIEADQHDLEVAPLAQASAGLRENSVRVGVDLIHGRSLAARTWNHDPAIGALIPGGSRPRSGGGWIAWIGGDLGYVGSDALLDGGPLADGPGVDGEPFSVRLRAGIMAEWSRFALSYSVAWLSPEFKGQDDGQLIGAVQLKARF